ncbi:Detected protein of confused Function [Hibiscus syriacus]|uniref:Detected protein of confused Function n=1 Tax=Hibiscus syriacus TaxID=106335 RepID=A0A6A2XEJ9_HIBSY|nr:Detected protein of confused Function [Hibiscus syriacus]
MGVKDSGELSSFGDNDCGCQNSRSLNFGGFDEFEEGEGETFRDDDDHDDFVALNSYSVQCDRTDDLESDMRQLLRSLKPLQVFAVLLSLDDERIALQFFYWADRQWRHSDSLKECKLSELSLMSSPTTVSSRVNEVRNLMEKMVKESNLLPDMVTYNTLIHMLSKYGHADEALEFLQEAEARGFQIDKVGHSAIVHPYCKWGKLEEQNVSWTKLKKMLQHTYKHDCKPNTVSYTALLTGLCRSGNSLQAREMMDGSEEEFWTPNAITYSAMMHGLRKEGKLSEACDVAKKMISKGFFPNPVEINLIIESLCREGKMDDAKRFLEECLNKGCAVNIINSTTLIHGYCRKDDLEAAFSLLDDMYLRVAPNTCYIQNSHLSILPDGKGGRSVEIIGENAFKAEVQNSL